MRQPRFIVEKREVRAGAIDTSAFKPDDSPSSRASPLVARATATTISHLNLRFEISNLEFEIGILIESGFDILRSQNKFVFIYRRSFSKSAAVFWKTKIIVEPWQLQSPSKEVRRFDFSARNQESGRFAPVLSHSRHPAQPEP